MKLMLDTNICIYLIKQHPPSALERFLSHPVGDIGISSITVAELDYGVSKSRHATKNRLALAQFLSPLEVASFAPVVEPPPRRADERDQEGDEQNLDEASHPPTPPVTGRPA